MREITKLHVETNITHPSNVNHYKTKAEILYELTLAILQGGRPLLENTNTVITTADNMYNNLVKNGIIEEV